jgi:hypothetical protein
MIYTLLLTSQNGTSVPTTSNTIYAINWDDLFKKKNYDFRTCRVKYEINSTTLQTTTTLYDYKTRNGYITANFATNNQGTPMNVSAIGGCILGTLSPIQQMSWYNGTAQTNSWISYRNSTLATNGVEINTPTGVGQLQISFYHLASTGPITPSIMDYDDEYTLVLQFEFDDE